MRTVTTTGPQRRSPLQSIEDLAWRIPLPSHTLFLVLAIGLALLLGGAGLASAAVASRNATIIDDVRANGLGIAGSATAFRTSLAAADADGAATLLSGGLEDAERRASYDANLLAASHALTEAALVATDDDRGDIAALADGLVRYAGLVETSRANSRQGFPVGSAYLTQARALARDDLAPRAERLRRSGEQRIARAANSVGGPVGVQAVVVLTIALLGVIAGGAVMAGRTRRILHPALVAAAALVVASLFVAGGSLATQSAELRSAATGTLDAVINANDASFALSRLRVTEISAVAARGSGRALYDQFRTDGTALLERVNAGALESAVREYVRAVDQVADLDIRQGDNRAAAAVTLDGESADAFDRAAELAEERVGLSSAELDRRFRRAADGDVAPAIPILVAVFAAALAAFAVLRRSRNYR